MNKDISERLNNAMLDQIVEMLRDSKEADRFIRFTYHFVSGLTNWEGWR